MNINVMTNYELIQQKELKDLKSEGYLLRHKKSGARVLLMENDDENKVFTIGFRTPPEDSTGLPHILEHSVKKFSGKRSICRARERIIEHIFECNDLSGQNGLSGGKLQ